MNRPVGEMYAVNCPKRPRPDKSRLGSAVREPPMRQCPGFEELNSLESVLVFQITQK